MPKVRLPIRATVKDAYSVFFRAPLVFTALGLAPFLGAWGLFAFAVWATDRTVEDGSDWTKPILLGAVVFYALLIACIASIVAGAAHALRGHGMPWAQTFAATAKRLPMLILSSGHVLAIFAAVVAAVMLYGRLGGLALAVAFALAMANATVFAFVLAACRIERRGPLGSIVRSVALSRGNRLAILAVTIVSCLPIVLAGALLATFGSFWIVRIGSVLIDALDLAAVSIVTTVAFQTLTGSPVDAMPPGERPPQQSKHDDEGDLATLAILYRQPEVATVLVTIRAHGIAAFAPDWGVATTASQWTVALGGIAVVVPSADLERAAAILAEIGPMPFPPRNFRCPRWLDVALHALILVSMFETGAYFPMPPRARGSYARPVEPA